MTNYCINPGDSIQLGYPGIPAPTDITTFLQSRGWQANGGYDWQHHAKARWNMTWEQALACEFYEFITIGGVR